MIERAWTLALSGVSHDKLLSHLHPGDGLEAAAILLCRIEKSERSRLLVYDQIMAPLDSSKRSVNRLAWPGKILSEAIDRAEDEGATIILIHSHPSSFLEFSEIDDESDRLTIPNIFAGWSETCPAMYHGSAIMTADGSMRARLYDSDHHLEAIDLVTVTGDDIRYFWRDDIIDCAPAPVQQPFFDGMASVLNRLSVAIIGVSGTGSIIAEQAARMGFGEIKLVDFDTVESKNLNRILNSTIADAQRDMLKVEMMKRAIDSYRDGVLIRTIPMSIADREAVLAAAQCDVIFCCVDTLEGRHILDLLAQVMLLPLFDVGVTIPTRQDLDKSVIVSDALGRVDYIQPGKSTLSSREVYSAASLRAEYLAHANPEAFSNEANEGYIKGAVQEAPSVIALNMRAASACMLEYVARAFPFRHESNADYARTIFSIAAAEEDHFSESSFDTDTHMQFANGLQEPLLGLPALTE